MHYVRFKHRTMGFFLRNERQHRIQELLISRGRVSVEELSSTLSVTPMTIRRDLTSMEQSGFLTRTHGGCVLRSPYVQELSFSEKEGQHPVQKFAIARAAVNLLQPHDSLYLDTGTTAVHVARILPADLELRVFTNNLLAAMELFNRDGVDVAVYGGLLASKNPDLIGEMALARMRDYRLSVALIGADALDVERGEFYAAEMGTATLSQAAQDQADRVLLMVDSSKFGKRGHAVVGKVSANLTIITDSQADPDAITSLEAGGTTVIQTTH